MSWKRLGVLAGALALGACFYGQDALDVVLGEGDVTAVLVGTPPGKTSRQPLQGARARIRGTPRNAVARKDGRVVLRNLPEGRHHISFFYDPDQDGVPDLVKALNVPIAIPTGKKTRSWVNVGEVELLPPGILAGDVETPPGDGPVLVVVQDSDVVTQADGNRHFELKGLGEDTWGVVAVQGSRMTVRQSAEVHSGQTTTLPTPLVWDTSTSVGCVTFTVSQAPQDTRVSITLAPLAGGSPVAFDAPLPASNSVTVPSVPAGVWFARVAMSGFQSVVIPNVVVFPGTAEPNCALVPLEAVPNAGSGGCVDLDGDGICADLDAVLPNGAPCHDTCLSGGTALTRGCNRPGTFPVDCDDDGDGQADIEERLGGANGEAKCTCTIPGLPQDGSTCEGDPTRVDRNHNGVCDPYEVIPPVGGSSSSGPPASSSRGTSSSSTAEPSSSAMASSGASTTSLLPPSSSLLPPSSSVEGSSRASTSASDPATSGASFSTGRSSSQASSGSVESSSQMGTSSSVALRGRPQPGALPADAPPRGTVSFRSVGAPLEEVRGVAPLRTTQWRQVAPNGGVDWAGAELSCASLGVGWTLPNIHEAMDIMDHSIPGLLPSMLQAPAGLAFWTSSGTADTSQGWAVDGAQGVPKRQDLTTHAAALCMRRVP